MNSIIRAFECLKRDPEQELEGKLLPLNPSLCDFAVVKKATITWFCCNKEGDDNLVLL
jgi:hypothetical protein